MGVKAIDWNCCSLRLFKDTCIMCAKLLDIGNLKSCVSAHYPCMCLAGLVQHARSLSSVQHASHVSCRCINTCDELCSLAKQVLAISLGGVVPIIQFSQHASNLSACAANILFHTEAITHVLSCSVLPCKGCSSILEAVPQEYSTLAW